MLKIAKPGFNSTWTMNFQMFKLDLEKAEDSQIRLPTFIGSSKNQESSRKSSISALLTMPKPLTVWFTINWKILKEMGIPDYLTSWEICMQVKKQQLELDIDQWTGSESGKEYVKAVYCHSAYLTYMQSTSCKMHGWMNHKLEWRLLGELSIASYMHMTPLLWQKMKKNKEPLDESEREWKIWLKTQHSEN